MSNEAIIQLALALAEQVNANEKKKKSREPRKSYSIAPKLCNPRAKYLIEYAMHYDTSLKLKHTHSYEGHMYSTFMDVMRSLASYINNMELKKRESPPYLKIDEVLLTVIGEENLVSLGETLYSKQTYQGEVWRILWLDGQMKNYLAKLASMIYKGPN